ncbi:MAG: metallophosphoesterase family protein [Candidatus Caldatribacterium sp.]|uniref:metallophosphoesterase family protein n=1 Tax=Candidatus Caldatribacterium sp. TaxID=2282143 RepID=UPI002995F26D|nr:metallophosphoesterase family protein [Candidatus Caldatribacterium sp.]MCX7729586.1 metallophosphoesterase family protein [Candidatus Caldatribacterium sp.]MDW8081372.1 metallophosphoesterase family protein [Candidatus Calescibacterium sp.]
MILLSDIHGNFDALEAIAQNLCEEDTILVLGDIVGYGAEPDRCVQWVRERKAHCLIGNHEACLLGMLPISWFNPKAAETILWTRRNISPVNLSFLETFPSSLEVYGCLFVHGSPRSPVDEYITNPWQAREIFEEGGFTVCFFGHTHVAEGYIWDGKRTHHVSFLEGGELVFEDGFRYLVNCGSVGQPRDGNPKASFGILFPEERRLEVWRVEYDVQAAARKILLAGLPEVLAYRLEVGE